MANNAASNEEHTAVELQNSTGRAYTILLEPWANEYELGPGKTVKIQAEGPAHQPPLVEIRDDYLVVWAAAGTLDMVVSDTIPKSSGG